MRQKRGFQVVPSFIVRRRSHQVREIFLMASPMPVSLSLSIPNR